jgi:hypothetical protein
VQNDAQTIYAYSSLEALLEGENSGAAKSRLTDTLGVTRTALTERPSR